MKKKNRIVFTGGSRIRSVNETIPFSKLIIEPQKLTLKTTFSGSLEISSQELLAVEEVFYVPILAQGIKIRHRNPNYKKTLIFWSLKDPQKIFKVLEEQGLVSAVQPLTGNEKQENTSSEFSEKIKVLTSPPLLVLFAAMILFAGFMTYKAKHRYDNYTRMGKASDYQIEVKKISVDHGVAFFNDSIIVPVGTKLISEKPEWFKHQSKPLFGEYPGPPNLWDLTTPFTIIKDADSFEFKILKYNDTLVFQIPDPDYKDPRDPSFGDLYQKLFKN